MSRINYERLSSTKLHAVGAMVTEHSLGGVKESSKVSNAQLEGPTLGDKSICSSAMDSVVHNTNTADDELGCYNLAGFVSDATVATQLDTSHHAVERESLKTVNFKSVRPKSHSAGIPDTHWSNIWVSLSPCSLCNWVCVFVGIAKAVSRFQRHVCIFGADSRWRQKEKDSVLYHLHTPRLKVCNGNGKTQIDPDKMIVQLAVPRSKRKF